MSKEQEFGDDERSNLWDEAEHNEENIKTKIAIVKKKKDQDKIEKNRLEAKKNQKVKW